MALTVLNNISSLTAENALANTQASLQKTLTQLSTGLKINSGSDDAAGLSIVSGMNANISALTQSQQNASNGIGMLQTADGALSQVTTLLNRAVTLATEGSTTGITASQSTALDTEFQSIPGGNQSDRRSDKLQRFKCIRRRRPTTYTGGAAECRHRSGGGRHDDYHHRHHHRQIARRHSRRHGYCRYLYGWQGLHRNFHDG